MANIQVLDQQTIDKIAAGEVVERPCSVVKELVENAIDAKATVLTVEIREGGTALIRVTDNGCGIEKEQIQAAFLRHATSKISSAEDLQTVLSLGFRGEALSSIAAVSQMEVITKTPLSITGSRYVIEGGKEVELEEIGAPEGTTFVVRNLFFNTPARRKFLKTPQTEGGYISSLMEHIALSHPEVSMKLIINGQVKLQTPGNDHLKDLIYQVFGRSFVSDILPLQIQSELFGATGFIGKPIISRGNRNYENFFVNGRYVKSNLLSQAVEEGYQSYMMQHKFPFVVIHLQMNSELVDVNVHPTKMELRFSQEETVVNQIREGIRATLNSGELIAKSPVEATQFIKPAILSKVQPEPFEKKRMEAVKKAVRETSPYEEKYEEQNLFQAPFLSPKAKIKTTIIGQVFQTYWLVEYNDSLYIIDQHAAHERILYEQTMKRLLNGTMSSQALCPPIIVSLSTEEGSSYKQFEKELSALGFHIESFGGKEYSVTAVPYNMLSIGGEDLLIELLDSLLDSGMGKTPQIILEKAAMMSCKAAVKGNQTLSRPEIESILTELLELENPYHCPHGRPTIVEITKKEMEKKFKRVL
ncbi:MAG: DNA mismatch repair endonuclease MutL [Lachnospiraceae bacterium]